MRNAKPPTVIVADSDRDCANAVAMLLAGAGMSVEVAYGGRAAIELTDAGPPPASVVIDIAMPDVSGIDVARHLRARYSNDVRIVGYTSWTGADEVRRATEAGFERIVAKDADPCDLLAALGEDGRAMVMRSLAASRRQLRLRLELANALLAQWRIAPDPDLAARTLAIVSRTLTGVDAALARLPLGQAERTELVLAVAELRGKLPHRAPG